MKLDPVTFEIVATKIGAIANEMGKTLYRTGRTLYVKEVGDFSTGLAGPDGRLVSAPTQVGLASTVDAWLTPALEAVGALEPGDVVLTNHPYSSGGLATHLPDVHVIMPYYSGGKIVAYGWSFLHLADIGGRVPSSLSPSNTNIFQEGLAIAPVKLLRRGVLNDDVLSFLRWNCRTPEENIGDIKAMVGTLRAGERRVEAIISQHGEQVFSDALKDVVEYAAGRARDLYRQIPDGVYEFCDYLDDDYVSPIPVRLHVKLTVSDGLLHADFSGTDPQLTAAFNLTTNGQRHYQLTFRLVQYILTKDPTIPLNWGILQPLSVTIPKGTVLNPEFPAAVGVRHAVAFRIADVLDGALSQALPEFVRAASSGIIIPVVLAEPARSGGRQNVVVLQPLAGGTGASMGTEGVDARDNSAGGLHNNPLESVEAAADVIVRRYGIRTDSGGAGKWRGGVGLEFTFEPRRAGSFVLARGMERMRFAPWGLNGGKVGATTRAIQNYGTDREVDLGKIDVVEIGARDRITFLTPGGGGYGDPFERDPAATLKDVLGGYVSIEAARRQYGVVIGPNGLDLDKTRELRGQLSSRRSNTPNWFDFGPEREIWEAVFDDAFMRRINKTIFSNHQAARQRVRDAIFSPVVERVRRGAPFELSALHAARVKVQVILEDLAAQSAGALQ